MERLTGLSGLGDYGRAIDLEDQASPEERSGDIADPRHAKVTHGGPYPYESAQGMNGSHGPYGADNQLLGDEWWFYQPAGDEWDDPTFDHTPVTRAAPFPKGVASGPVPGESPDHIAEQLRQSAIMHSVKTGAGLKVLYPVSGLGHQNDEWAELDNVTPGNTDLTTLPKQAMSSGFMFGTTDRTQSMARQNSYGYDSAHHHRRYATGSIPGNTMWMKPGGRPLVKTMAGPARLPTGLDSPFHGQDTGAAFGIHGAVLQNIPTEYAPPSQPYLAPANTPVVTGDDADVVWY